MVETRLLCICADVLRASYQTRIEIKQHTKISHTLKIQTRFDFEQNCLAVKSVILRDVAYCHKYALILSGILRR